MHFGLVTKHLQTSDLKYKIRVHHKRNDWLQNYSTVPNKSLYMWLVILYDVTLNHFKINLGKWLQMLKKWI